MTAEVLPLRFAMWGLPGALSVIMIAPLRTPVPVGVKVTLIVHLLLAGTLAPQVLVWAKSPVATMLVMLSGAFPLVSDMVSGLLVVPRLWLEKTRPLGLRAIPVRILTLEINASQLPFGKF